MNWIKWLLPVLMLSAAGMHEIQAQQLSGELVLEQGLVKVRRRGVEIIYRRKGTRIQVFQNDVIQSGPKSRATVSLRGQQELVKLFSNSHLRIDQHTASSTSFGMAIGKAIFSRFRKVLGSENFGVRTPTATLGVKGTEFVLGTDARQSYVLTLSGLVGVTNRKFPEKEVIVAKDQVFISSSKKPAAPPVKVSSQVRERIIREDGIKSFQEVAESAGRIELEELSR